MQTAESASSPAGVREWGRRIAAGVAIAYAASLFVIAILIRTVGEGFWATDVCMYLPSVAFGLPLPFVTLGLLATGQKRLLLTQLFALLVVVFPLMGFVLPWPSGVDRDAPSIRVLSYNVDSGRGGYDKIVEQIDHFKPDVVLLQETGRVAAFPELLKTRYPTVETSTQFLVASRFPLTSTNDPERVPHGGKLRSPRFIQYLMETPLGPIAFYNVHPISPRTGFYAMREGGLRHAILSGAMFTGEKAQTFRDTSELRAQQVEAFSELAHQENSPVVIAGDTNLTGGSPLLRRNLSGFRDGFVAASWGFGYTFPTPRHAWMRLDRIFASEQLRIATFEVGDSKASDHFCVVADIQRRKP